MSTQLFKGRLRYLIAHPWDGGRPVIIEATSEISQPRLDTMQVKYFALKKSGDYKHVKLIEIEPHEAQCFTCEPQQKPAPSVPPAPPVQQFTVKKK